jgi:16S rRNA (guanine966-N2)-methyltransferase
MSLRVVAGTAGGLFLQVPKRAVLRPTQDRIKQAVFSSLGEYVQEARVLDLFAGTGALGIEALSRGAGYVRFVEQQRECADCLKANLQHCRLTGDLFTQDVYSYLRTATPEPFDLVLADPPYEKKYETVETPALLMDLLPWVKPGAWLILEHFSGQKLGTPAGWRLDRSRAYGETAVSYFQRIENSPTPH